MRRGHGRRQAGDRTMPKVTMVTTATADRMAGIMDGDRRIAHDGEAYRPDDMPAEGRNDGITCKALVTLLAIELVATILWLMLSQASAMAG